MSATITKRTDFMNEPSIITIIPPIAAIIVAVWRKNALIALAFGLWLTYFLSSDFSPVGSVTGTFSNLYATVTSTGNFRILLYSLLIGSLLALMKQSGGINAFVDKITGEHLVNSRAKAAAVPPVIGSMIFTDTNLSLFSAGMASQKLFERFNMSRAKLAYLIDSTCAPISVLILVNGWGAYILGLIEAQKVEAQIGPGVGVLIDTLAYNFYALLAVVLAYFTAISGKVFGPMKHGTLYTEPKHKVEGVDIEQGDGSEINPALDESVKQGKASYFWLPLAAMVLGTFALLWHTGEGDLRKGSGSFSVLWSVIGALVLLVVMLLKDKVMSLSEIAITSWTGLKDMAPVVAILLLSFAFGDAVKSFGTGVYVSGVLSTDISLFLVAPAIFITASVMAFATGSSWSTFAILIPIAIPTAIATGLPPGFLVAAVLGGGIFGDHASPISDTTVVASIASDCDHIEHVKTQLPYALGLGVITIVLYMLVGAMM